MTAFLTGHGVPPALVGLVRGALIAGGLAICEVILKGLTDINLGGIWIILVPLLGGGVRTAEGVLDGLKKPPPDPTRAQVPPGANTGAP